MSQQLTSAQQYILSVYDSLLNERNALKRERDELNLKILNLNKMIESFITKSEENANQLIKCKRVISSQSSTIARLNDTINELNEQIIILECNHDKRIIEHLRHMDDIAAKRLETINEQNEYIKKLEIRNKDLTFALLDVEGIPKSKSFP